MPEEQIYLRRLGALDERPEFDCSDSDLNEFFRIDSKDGFTSLMSVTYAVERGNSILAFFCLSNDSIKQEEISRSKLKVIRSKISPRAKRYKSMPAVKIGRLGVSSSIQSGGMGSQIIDYIKAWFTDGNKTGCRFILVDALNNERTVNFYKKTGLIF